MLVPIQKDNELICPGCGVVLQTITDFNEPVEKPIIPYSVDMLLLGTAMVKNVKYAYGRTSQQYQEEQVLKRLISITKEFSLPESLAIQTFNQLKRKNRGFWSEKEPIKQLIKILSKDDNFIYIKKLQALKARYEKIINC